MIDQLHEVKKREMELIENNENKLQDLVMEFDVFNEQNNIQMTNEFQSSSSLDRPRPFNTETPPLNLNMPKSENFSTKIEKL